MMCPVSVSNSFKMEHENGFQHKDLEEIPTLEQFDKAKFTILFCEI